MNKIWKNISGIAPVILAAIVGLGAVVSLSDYTAPVYGAESEDEQEGSETVIENASNESVEEPETETEFENTETVAVLTGAFDLADGTYEGSANGFSGKIKVSVEIRNQTIQSINILSNSDDAAFFNRAKEGVTASILAKQSTDVDTVSGATYSSKGIINAVKDALSSGDKTKKTAVAKGNFTLDDGYYEGTGTGFAGPVKLFIEIKDKSIVGIYIVKTSDDAGFFNRAKEGVTASILEKQSTDVDTVSGATYSSRGIIDAVKNALTGETEDAFTIGKGDFDIADGTYTGSAQGYSGTVTVSVKVENRTITAIDIVSQSDTESYFERAKGVIRTILAGQTVNVDAVSGATFSSNGIINAVKNALGLDKEETEKQKKGKFNYPDGVYTGVGEGYGGDIAATMVLQDKTIKAILITDHKNEDDRYFNQAKKVADTIIDKQSLSVDTVSGATYSSKGIIEAVSNAMKAAKKGKTDTETQDDTEKPDTSNASSYYGVVVCNPDESGAFTSYNLHVKVMFQNGKIIEVSDVYGDGGSQNDTYITKAVSGSSKHPGVAAQIVKKNGIDGVDTVSGATCTSKAVMHAVEVVAKAAEKDGIYTSSGSQNDADDTKNSEDTEKDSENTEKDSENTENNSENTEKDSEDTENNGGNTENGSDSTESGGDTEKNDTENTEDSGEKTLTYKNGNYKVNVVCNPDEDEDFDAYNLTVTVVIENDKITEIRDISGDGGKSNSFYIKAASKGVVSQILQKNSTEGIDTVSSATCSSKAIIEACQKALEQAKN